MRPALPVFTAAALALATLPGCGGTDAVGPVEAAIEAAIVPAETLAKTEPQPPVASETKVVRKRAAKYRAPFPNRTELFSPPANARRVARKSNSGYEDSVELMGFVQVDAPHAVLSIDGVVTPIALGDEKGGVQVITIQPPIAVLQRGRNRWTATLD